MTFDLPFFHVEIHQKNLLSPNQTSEQLKANLLPNVHLYCPYEDALSLELILEL